VGGGGQVEVKDETTAITTVPSHTWPHYTSQCLHIFLKCPTTIARKKETKVAIYGYAAR
jgi:hypothetical protein